MAGNLVNLILNIDANTTNISKSLSETKGDFLKLGEGLDSLKTQLVGAFEVTAILEAGKALGEFALQVGENTNKVKELSELTGTALKNVTASIMATSSVFKTDFNTTLTTVNSLSKNFGLSWEESSKLVQQSMALNENRAEEFLSVLKEYTPQFKELGLSAKQAAALLTDTEKSGVDAATAIGALAKANQNIRSYTSATAMALKGIGIDVEQLTTQISTGSITQFEAIQKISAAMGKFSDSSSQVGDVLKNVFGKSGVQAGADYIKSLSTMNLSLDDLVNKSEGVEKANLRIAAATTELDKTWVGLFGTTSTGFAELKANALELAVDGLKKISSGVVGIANYFIDLWNNSKAFRIEVEALIGQFKIMFDIFKGAASLLIDAFSTAGKLIKEVLKGNFSDIPKIIKEGFGSGVADFKQLGTNIGNDLSDGVKAVMSKEKIPLIDLNEVKKEAQEAGKIIRQSMSSGSGADSSSSPSSPADAGSKKSKGDPIALLKLAPMQLKNADQMMKKLNTSVQGLGASYKQAGQWLADLGQQGAQAFSSLGSALADLATGQKKQLAEQVQDLKNAVEKIVAAKLAQAIASGVASSMDLPEPAGAIVAAGVSALVYGLFKAIPGFSTGTNFTSAPFFLAGENGPEIVSTGGSGASVYTASQTRNMLSGGNGSMNLNGEFRIRGNDLVYVINNANRRLNAIG